MSSLFSQVFDEHIDILINSRVLVAIRPRPEIENDRVLRGSHALFGDSVTMTDDCAEHILSRMLGMPLQTGNDGDDDYSASFLAPAQVTINEIIEIFDLTEEIRFVKPESVRTVYNVVNSYLAELNKRRRYDPNISSGVPEEDIEKMENLIQFFKPAAEKLGNPSLGNDVFSRLLKTATKTSRHGTLSKTIADDGYYISKRTSERLEAVASEPSVSDDDLNIYKFT